MRAVRAIAANTFREAIRDRILYLFIGFAVVMVVSSKLFGMLTVGDETKIIKDIGLAAMQFFSMLIAVMMSMILISREVDSRTVFNILANPVRRWQFILGKYLGLVSIVAVNLALITLVLMLTVLLAAGELDLMLLFAGAMTMLEMLVLAAFATLFAVLTRPILGSLMTLAVFVVGHMSGGARPGHPRRSGRLGRSLCLCHRCRGPLPRQPPLPGQGLEVKRTLGSLAVIAVLLGVVVLSEVRLGKITREDPLGRELLYLPSPEMLKIMSLGNPGLVSTPRAIPLSRDCIQPDYRP